MTKINLTIRLTKNYQTVEIGATDIDPVKYYDTEDWLLKNAQVCLNRIVPEEGEVKEQYQSNYREVQNPKGATASQKQVNFLRKLGYAGDVTQLSVTEANDIIKKLKAEKGIQ